MYVNPYVFISLKNVFDQIKFLNYVSFRNLSKYFWLYKKCDEKID